MTTTITQRLAYAEGLSEIDFLRKYLAMNENNINKTADKIGIFHGTLRISLERNGIYNAEPSVQLLRRLYKGDCSDVSENIEDSVRSLRRDNPNITFKSFRSIIGLLIKNERMRNASPN